MTHAPYFHLWAPGVNTLSFAIDDDADGSFDGTWSHSATFTVGPPPPISCEVEMTQGAYTDGETITVQVLRYANPLLAPLANVRLRLHLQLVGTPEIAADLINIAGLTLPPRHDPNLGPFELITVQPNLPRGTWSLDCAIEDSTSGASLAQDTALFDIQ